jgi:hypothetical protein
MTSSPSSVLIGVPAYTGSLACETADGLLRTRDLYASVLWMMNCCNIGQARNAIVSYFMRSQMETLIMVDTDIVFQRADMARLLSHGPEIEVVGGIYRLRTVTGKLAYAPLNPEQPPPKAAELVPCAGVGTGFIRIRRTALQRMIDGHAHRAYTQDGNPAWDLFPVGPLDGQYVSDDYQFCRLARTSDINIWADTGIILGHKGATVLTLEIK